MAISPQQLPDLPYDYNALEPVISAKIMEIHHKKHHKAYVDNLNIALEKENQAEQKQGIQAISEMIDLQSAIQFNGGGHINHSIFWTNLTPQKSFTPPEGALLEVIKKDFGSLDKLIEVMSAKTLAIQGSGWGWLGFCPQKKQLDITTCPNQTPLRMGLIPLLGIDVWEHAYYLQYENRRADYLSPKAIWTIINWKNVAERYQAALSK